MYKAISDSLENNKIMLLSIQLNYLIYIIKLWMNSTYARKHQQICKNCADKHFVVQRFILILYNNGCVHAVIVKSTGIRHIGHKLSPFDHQEQNM